MEPRIKSISDKLKRRKFNRRGLWHHHDDASMTYQEALQLSLDSLNAYGSDYPNWVVAYSGGKDSSALVAFVLFAIQNNLVAAPASLTVIYADTRMELPPLRITAASVLARVREFGHRAQIVQPELRKRFWSKILGQGVPPPKQSMRWCTRAMKKDPIDAAMNALGKDTLTLTGVRQGESRARDQRINASCSTSAGECGQGWFQQQQNALAPLLHWRVCWIWDFLNSQDNPLPETLGIAPVYITDDITDIRTGCIGCNLVQRDWALESLVKTDEYAYLAPLQQLRPLYDKMLRHEHRHQRGLYEKTDGSYSPHMSNTVGPLSIAARKYFYGEVLRIESEAGYPLISLDEREYIRWCWNESIFPRGWTGEEPLANDINDESIVDSDGNIVATQLSFDVD